MVGTWNSIFFIEIYRIPFLLKKEKFILLQLILKSSLLVLKKNSQNFSR